jgi:hypothetical protein
MPGKFGLMPRKVVRNLLKRQVAFNRVASAKWSVNFDYAGAAAAPCAAVVVGREARLQTAQPWHPQIRL